MTACPGSIFEDPIMLHHIGSAIFRLLELKDPDFLKAKTSGESEVDAEFIEPESVNLACSECGRTASNAYEQSMGMYCEKTENGIHRMVPGGRKPL